ncbi:MAG TPA: pentapeptide repeat-containing protein [Leptolyngbyaceae cyanobacterium M33_DOE_097]|uniref:Pentapeptide repeat-containing protein n=1 Tax=Oscillatoriales cyanobacterium SpSt-418 TaxID=2282169 RepID=A0A7C3KDC5_9CYAN|nr:pentapeptide repeat-containing protein [Leptolyngbyaceae cyanobacterium M33_DOE_097]
MHVLRQILNLCVALTLVFHFLTPPALAASSAAIRAFDDLETTAQNYAGQSLIRAEFGDAKLVRADFSKADLRGAVFNGASLKEANLKGANFEDGIAYITDFSGADLSDAIFVSAMLLKSSFKGAIVNGADFTNAVVDRAQIVQMCKTASGVNSVTGVDTRESLGCP